MDSMAYFDCWDDHYFDGCHVRHCFDVREIMANKKKKKVQNNKRILKNVKKKLARRQAFKMGQAQVKYIMQARRAARRGEGMDVGGPQVPNDRYELDDEIEISQCDGVGDCCFNRAVILDPGDVQRILNNKRVQDTFGVEVTADLYRGAEDGRGLLRYHLDSKAGVPMCIARRDFQEDGNETCVFAESGDDNTAVCMLGDDRPTVCKSNPVHRVAKLNEVGRLEAWQYVVSEQACVACPKCSKEKQTVKVESWMVDHGMEERLSVTDLFHGFNGWLVREIKTEEMKQLACLMIFDFDSYSMEIGGVAKEEAIKNRPPTGQSAIAAAKYAIEGISGRMESDNGASKVKRDTEE